MPLGVNWSRITFILKSHPLKVAQRRLSWTQPKQRRSEVLQNISSGFCVRVTAILFRIRLVRNIDFFTDTH